MPTIVPGLIIRTAVHFVHELYRLFFHQFSGMEVTLARNFHGTVAKAALDTPKRPKIQYAAALTENKNVDVLQKYFKSITIYLAYTVSDREAYNEEDRARVP